MQMKQNQLTKRQKEVFEFIKKRIKEGLPPTMREIANNFNITENTAYGHVECIVKKGYLQKEFRKGRAIFIK